jgi:hypothetical protein
MRKKKSYSTKSEQWDELGDSIITFHARRFNKALADLDDGEFIDAYTKVLEYFKPKLARKEVRQEITPEERVLTIEIVGEKQKQIKNDEIKQLSENKVIEVEYLDEDKNKEISNI